ncbi:MarR family winged helix-turn-helix transcriptional regulator [Devosia lacusdianchii]|uniref:MarR family winged helix-turn-helix transcriptional regulator n=1 Tax=Devosia lacusdianchii TaxID=2917991 RepID=UPI001F06DF47|nr:MarR family winged helix-turn-helix transcriptional regulator [Devosia sp. JXJ CY 41]
MSSTDAKAARALSALFLDIFRANARLVSAGDQLVAPLGLTSARWQVLGAVAMAAVPQPVAHIARDLGTARQGVQRLVNELLESGFVQLEDNPHHRRAKLVCMTDQGRDAFRAIHKLQTPWVETLVQGMDTGEIAVAAQILQTLRTRLEQTSSEPAD